MKFDYKGNSYKLILLSVTGSRLYGTFYDSADPDRQHPFLQNYSSDDDFRGVMVAHPDTKVGLEGKIEEIELKKDSDGNVTQDSIDLIDEINKKLGKQVLKHDADLIIYEVKKFIKLALENNPNIMDIIYTDDDAVVYENKKGKKLRKNGKDIFMSLKTKFTFSGYAVGQLKRIRGTIQYSDKTLKILTEALKSGDIDDAWLQNNFKGLHRQKLMQDHIKVINHTT
jgi:predicted nucleotidyltransferase